MSDIEKVIEQLKAFMDNSDYINDEYDQGFYDACVECWNIALKIKDGFK